MQTISIKISYNTYIIQITHLYLNHTNANRQILTNLHNILHIYYLGSSTSSKSIRIEATCNYFRTILLIFNNIKIIWTGESSGCAVDYNSHSHRFTS